MALEWKGVMPAMTTCFKEDLSIDRDFAATHARWLVNHGCTGIVTPGSLGEGATLTFEEKVALWQTCVRAAGGERLAVFVGVDDAIVEGIGVGAVGWIAGLANALPKESVDLFNYARNGERAKAFKLYAWFLPLLRMDTVPKFVQLIKLVQQEVGMGSARVRPPRLEVVGAELEQAQAIIHAALEHRPRL